MQVEIGVIGGSGVYDIAGVRGRETLRPDTPFGPPSGDIVVGELEGVQVAFVARHGQGHRIPPSHVPYRANILALKGLGAHTVVAVNAVGSLDLDLAPGDLAVPGDLFDRTYGRPATFFGPGLVAHVAFAQPLCAGVRRALVGAGDALPVNVHGCGVLAVVEGPRFSTRAESTSLRAAGFALVGMTTMPEAALAREAEMCYASLCIVTDYDSWRADAAEVTVDQVIETMHTSVRHAEDLLRRALPALAARSDCTCRHALADALTTAPGAVDQALARQLDVLVGRYLHQSP